NAVLLPYVIAYNAGKPTKFPTFPKYGEFVADYRYAQIARQLGLAGRDETQDEQVAALIQAVRALMKRLNMPLSIRECGVDEEDFLRALPGLAERAFEDQCTTANPRYPLISELAQIYKKAYYGE
ncbi:MAG: iron-containing alcohol dehydrogenase, partial [Clostridiales bacterium]|nr:iron-containing alcohol dehydrogenase [Clostridiales bacterium]